MYVNSRYRQMLESASSLSDRGYNYNEGGLLGKFVSSRMYLNDFVSSFLSRVDTYLIEMAESVKKIQFYRNYTIDKNDRSINF